MSTNDIQISTPSLVDRSIQKADPKREKNQQSARVVGIAISALVVVVGVLLILISQGVLPHCLNAITQALGHAGVRLLPYVGAVCIVGGLSYAVKESAILIFRNPIRRQLAVRLFSWIVRVGEKEAALLKDSVICKMRNAPSLSALTGERIADKFTELRANLLADVREALNGDIDGHDHEDFEEKKRRFLQSLDAYEKETYTSAQIVENTKKGICNAIELMIVKRVLAGEDLEEVCREYSKGGDETMVALQFMNETLPEDVFISTNYIGGIVGFRRGLVSDISEDGLYKIGIRARDDGFHTILLQRKGDTFYLLDSNYFLMKFDISEFGTKMRDFFSIYYETAQQIDLENFNGEALCRQFEVTKYFLPEVNVTWGVPYDEENASDFLLWGAEKKDY